MAFREGETFCCWWR
uniref:Uncharacterized protein n=1 Tax=Arundo donax TaxID=35708 RepID=A0A0A9AHQ3_ARUDO